MPLLEVSDLRVNYGAITAVQGIDLFVEKGEIVTLLGANGAGKSSTLSAIVNLVKPSSGKIMFDGQDITWKPTANIVEAGISQAMEGRQIFPRMTTLENLHMGGYISTKEEIEVGIERAYELFPILKERSKQMAGTLSGGEQQMLSIARALINNPKLLLLDEPSLGLAPMIIQDVFNAIVSIRDEFDTSILLVEQNARVALAISSRGYVMEKGKIVIASTAEKLLNDEKVIHAYLGGESKALREELT
ncbi:MAG TPA: ABC transporter ATP-binding protein [Clostridiaceae bacterium]|jgi:branched-chain amino acid transport system ATP-binding protein|nr:ABC transporter ATP-binding protein [Clostridiaceae bacterium]